MKRTRINRKRPGPPRRGRVVDPEFVAWVAENHKCVIDERALTTATLSATLRSMAGEQATPDPCCGRLTIHHVRRYGEPKSDRRILLLCQGHHLHAWSATSIEHGKEQFEQIYGVDIEARIAQYWQDYAKEA